MYFRPRDFISTPSLYNIFYSLSFLSIHLISIPFFYPNIGWEEKCVYKLALGANTQGHFVQVITSKSQERDLSIFPFRVIESDLIIIGGMPFSINLLNILKEEISKSDIVHIHFPPGWFSECACLYCLLYSKPYILHVHLMPRKTTKLGFLLKPYLLIFFKKMLQRADKIIVATNYTKNLLNP